MQRFHYPQPRWKARGPQAMAALQPKNQDGAGKKPAPSSTAQFVLLLV
jgi:hypothetical protein